MSDDRAPHVFETPGGFSVSHRGRLLYSGRDPARLPRRLGSACDPGPSRLHLIPSPLLWYGVPELLAAMGPGSALLCVETDPSLAELARSHMPPELVADERAVFLESSSPEEILDVARSMGVFRTCVLVALSGGQSPAMPVCSAVAAALAADFEASWRNRAALMILGHRWARNIFDNIAAIPAIAPVALPHFPGAVIVCGAGPSLEEALSLITQARSTRRTLGVIACDTALGTLLAAGIEPDLVVCLEGQAHNLADFTCLGTRRTTLVADLSSHPAGFHAVRGPKSLTFVRITPSLFLARLEAAFMEAGLRFQAMPPLGSVGVHAVHVAGLLSHGPILAAGLDFSFEPGKTHARGCPSLLAEERRLTRLTRWPGQYAASFRDRTIALDEDAVISKAAVPAGETPRTLSDPILLSYASLMADRFGDGGLYDLRSRGPSIGGRRVSLAEAESFLSTSNAEPAPALGGVSGLGSVPFDADRASKVLAAFLRDEVRRLDSVRLSMHGTAPLERGDFRRLVSESDYLWWGFPDQERARELPQDFLNRLVPQVEFWSRRVAALSASMQQ